MKITNAVIISFFIAGIAFSQGKQNPPQQKVQTIQSQSVAIDTTAKIKITPMPQTTVSPSRFNLHIPWQLFEQIRLSAYVDTHFVLLRWTPIKAAKGYNLYCKVPGGRYKKLNSKPIVWPTDQAMTDKMFNKLLPTNQFKLERDHIRNATNAEFYPQFTNTKLQPQFHNLGELYYQVALIIGEAYADSSVQSGKIYHYKAKYIDGNGSENDLGNEVSVKAGAVKKIFKPTGLTAEAGDGEILLLWDDPVPSDMLNGYHVYKAASSSGPFLRCDSIPVLVQIKVNLQGDSLNPPQYGYLDTNVKNYTTYYYRIAARNPLGRIGPTSDPAKVMPRDLTPPRMPQNIDITPLKTNALYLTWNQVNKDVHKRNEVVERYQIFRYNDYNTAVADSAKDMQFSLAYVTEPWSKPGVYSSADTVRSYTDQNVVPEKVYWYRIACEDTAGNVGSLTSAISGLLPDYEPPDPPKDIAAEGYDDYILISWSPPDTLEKKNKDLAGYMIYRGICGGYHEVLHRDEGDLNLYHAYPLHLLADITDKDSITCRDYSLPKGSPICYRYALKAYDKAQNISVMSDSVCERLRDKTPPDVPVITALKALNKAIKIECVAAPIQDIKGFVVERSENEQSGYQVVYFDSVPAPPQCGDIPSSADSILANKVNQLSYVDQGVAPEKIYWYRVLAFDHNNNKSAFSPPVSTFTFEIKSIPKPSSLMATIHKQRDGSCAVELAWQEVGARSAPSDTSFLGYVVFRSFEKDNGYRQISTFLKSNRFEDTSVGPGMTCWYRVQAFLSNGDRSPGSDAVQISISH
jgi:hypothetical protein